MGATARLPDNLAISPVVGILRRCSPRGLVEVVEAAVGAGLRAVEITMDSEDAAGQLRTLAQALPDEVALGAGTVMSVPQVDAAVDAGATFVVAPNFDPGVVAYAAARGVDTVPGVLSATEVAAASSAGVTLCKLFPSGPLGTGYLEALRGPFPQVPFLCTGGIDAANAASFIRAGAVGVGLSSEIFDPSAVDQADTDAVAAATSAVLAAVAAG